MAKDTDNAWIQGHCKVTCWIHANPWLKQGRETSLDPEPAEGPAALAEMQTCSYSNTISVQTVLNLQVDSMILKVFSHQNDSVIL